MKLWFPPKIDTLPVYYDGTYHPTEKDSRFSKVKLETINIQFRIQKLQHGDSVEMTTYCHTIVSYLFKFNMPQIGQAGMIRTSESLVEGDSMLGKAVAEAFLKTVDYVENEMNAPEVGKWLRSYAERVDGKDHILLADCEKRPHDRYTLQGTRDFILTPSRINFDTQTQKGTPQ